MDAPFGYATTGYAEAITT